jgi:hypothetical protein
MFYSDFSHFFELMQNDHFVFIVGNSSLEVRNIRLVNRITSMTEESKLSSENMPPNVIHC